MPFVSIELTQDEAERVDILAHEERRARKGQVHILFAAALAAAERAKNEKQETEKP